LRIGRWNLDRSGLRSIYNRRIRHILYPSYLSIEKNLKMEKICILIQKYMERDGRTIWMNDLLKVINSIEGDFEDGLTAIMVNRNEIMFEDSIRSIIRYVDKIILVDASTDNEYERVLKICNSLDDVEIYRTYPDYGYQINLALAYARTKWVMRWDSDWTTTEKFPQLIDYMNSLPKGRYAIEFSVIDPISGKKYSEDYLFTNNKNLLKPHFRKIIRNISMKISGKIPKRRKWTPYPWDYNYIVLEEIYAYHHDTTKLEWRKIEGKYQAIWSTLSKKERNKWSSFEEFVRKKEENR